MRPSPRLFLALGLCSCGRTTESAQTVRGQGLSHLIAKASITPLIERRVSSPGGLDARDPYAREQTPDFGCARTTAPRPWSPRGRRRLWSAMTLDFRSFGESNWVALTTNTSATRSGASGKALRSTGWRRAWQTVRGSRGPQDHLTDRGPHRSEGESQREEVGFEAQTAATSQSTSNKSAVNCQFRSRAFETADWRRTPDRRFERGRRCAGPVPTS